MRFRLGVMISVVSSLRWCDRSISRFEINNAYAFLQLLYSVRLFCGLLFGNNWRCLRMAQRHLYARKSLFG